MTLGGLLSWCLMGGLALGSVAGLAWRALGREPTPWPEDEWPAVQARSGWAGEC